MSVEADRLIVAVAKLSEPLSRIGEAFESAMLALAECFAPLADVIEDRHEWWPHNDDAWIRFAGEAVRSYRFRLAWSALRRAWRSHASPLGFRWS